ncbi:transcription termination factor Rho [Butyrivibrio sp. MC2013]|uniref:transcription termination factor Rho n=1 Tax=Butyrivibrio sp. MC2013 TaxID=1280686 RepID=UPI0004025C15|nr:transcription termination factor Rho [Butyrivibrio sp. MC2013]
MRERYETLKLADLRALAKIRGIKSVTTLKKSEIIDQMVALDEKQPQAEAAADTKAAPAAKEEKAESRKSARRETTAKEDKARSSKGRSSKTPAAADETAKEAVKEAAQDKKEAPAADRAPQGDKGKITRKHVIIGGMGAPSRNGQAHPQTPSKAPMQQPVKTSKPAEQQRNDFAENRSEASDNTARETQEEKGIKASGILEVMPDGFGFIRCENYLPGENDVYVAPAMIRKLGLRTGDILVGSSREKTDKDKFGALIKVDSVNGYSPEIAARRTSFQKMTPIFPDEKLILEREGGPVAMRIMDMICPIGKGQRGMIVSPPKAGKTTLLKDVAKSIQKNYPNIHLIILLIDERPEEVTDIRESITGENAEVIYSTFDELPEHHTRVAEMTIERARRLVEHKQDVMILIDSITRLTRAYNQVVPPSGRTLSGGLDPAALHMPKRFFGAARNMREGGSLTILATALIETGSKMDDVVYEEFKGTGNMEMILNRKLQERRVFPAIDIPKSSTRREDLLLSPDEMEAVNRMRKGFIGLKADNAVDQVINLFSHTRNNREFVRTIMRQMF